MKRYTANLKVEVEAESIEARDFVLEMLETGINRKPPGVRFPDVGAAAVRRAKISRVRTLAKSKKS